MSLEGAAWLPEGWQVIESEMEGREVNPRDELALTLCQKFSGWMGPAVSYDVADAIIAAGYSKHSEELAKYKRGAKTLGEIIEKQCRNVLDVTGLHHLINEDGDGHWDAVWMRLFEMRDELASLKESTIGRERARGDSWRERAQEMTVRAEAAEAVVQRVRHLLDATDPNRYAILSVEGLRAGIRSALEEGEPA